MTMTWPGNKVPSDVPIDVGIITVGAVTAAWAATEGGLTWDAGKKVRHITWDGQSHHHVGLHRTTGYDAKLSGKIKRGGPALMLDLEPGSSSDGSSGSDGNVISLLDARKPWTTGMYLTDVRFCVRQQDGFIMRVHMPKAFVEKYKLVTKDNDEGQWDIEIVPAKPTTDTNSDTVPFTVEYIQAA
jgi:hypothetical protein